MRRLLVLPTLTGGILVLSAAGAEPTPAPKAPVYRACPADMVWRDIGGGCVCANGLRWDQAAKRCSTACPPWQVQAPNAPPGTCVVPPHTCAPGKRWSEAHDGCIVVCPGGKTVDAARTGCIEDPHHCPADTQWYEAQGACLPFCAPGKSLDYKNGSCVDDTMAATPPAKPSAPRPPPSPPPQPPPPPTASASRPPPRDKAPRSPSVPKACAEGKEWKDAFDACVPICPADQVLDFYGVACHPIRSRR